MTVPVAGGGVHTCAAELEEGCVVLALGGSEYLQTVNGQIPGCDVGVLLAEFCKLALPYFVGEIPVVLDGSIFFAGKHCNVGELNPVEAETVSGG